MLLRERMLEAQVQEDAAAPVTWADADRYGDPGDNLESALEVVSPSNPGINECIAVAFCHVRSDY